MLILSGEKRRVAKLLFVPNGRTLIAPASRLQVWESLADGAGPTTVLDYLAPWDVQVSRDGRFLVISPSGKQSSRRILHDLTTGTATDLRTLCPGGWFSRVAISPDCQHLLVGENLSNAEFPARLCCRPLATPDVARWSVPTGALPHPPYFFANGQRLRTVHEPRWAPSGALSHLEVIRDAQTGETLAEAAWPAEMFAYPTPSPDGRFIASRKGIQIAIVPADDVTAKPVIVRNDVRRDFTGLAFHPSGRFLAATSNDATVKFFDVTNWTVAAAFDWGIGQLRSIAFSGDGMLAAAGGEDGRIVVWDVDL